MAPDAASVSILSGAEGVRWLMYAGVSRGSACEEDAGVPRVVHAEVCTDAYRVVCH